MNGEYTSGRGRATNVFVKEADDWLLMHEHLSPLPEIIRSSKNPDQIEVWVLYCLFFYPTTRLETDDTTNGPGRRRIVS